MFVFPLRCHITTAAEEGAVREEAPDHGGVGLLFLFCSVWSPDSRSVGAVVTFKSPAF